MKLIVFGATGSVGVLIVKQALQQGHEVSAFARNPGKLQALSNKNLKLIKGDVLNRADVESAIANHDAVLCTIGDGKIGKVRAAGTRNIISAMNGSKANRLICLTTLGAGDSYGNLNFIWKYVMFGFVLKKAFRDHQEQECSLVNSHVDYTIVRPGALHDGTLTNKFKIGFDGKFRDLSLKISRANVADFMLSQVLDTRYCRKAVSISD